ncbi:hypothetical protein MCOR25_006015 [Pyricularia grisea]|uniref:Uncharacterized protein n=1 Tax=Pyricularia grisea TaxID=148305 RepID=A0A6P8BKH9_PYRGI|nr:uncharacterized protein PgNI_01672 [Pyricularia grisea]KAI6363070.1 hypothetical protein MCOR25_006015 [Pyricularia grisea]TLD17087.1 hypothetical protein PgNI_01672 [Pyricularia grisea]
MIAKSFVTILAAASLASAQSQCTQSTITINSSGDASNLKSCKTLKGNVVIGNQTDSTLTLDGPEEIQGDLTMVDNKKIVSFSSTSLKKITGKMTLERDELLSDLRFPNLSEVNSISWVTLSALSSLGTAIKKASTVVIADTRIENLNGLDLVTVDNIDINNNQRLQKFTSKLESVSTSFKASVNGLGTNFEFPALKWVAEMAIANASSFTAPQLNKVNNSIYFDFNFIKDATFPNLTAVGKDFSFVGNSALTNISAPQLTSIGGGLTIANNTALESIDGLPKLKDVGGAVLMRGSFKSVSLPSLNDVKGVFDTQSTTDIDSSCEVFKKAGSNGQIQGKVICESNNSKANDDITAGSGSGSSNNNKNSATGTTTNMALLGLCIIGGAIVSFL